MRYVKYVWAIVIPVLLTSAATATCDFPYYPEFADKYTEYDEVTPLLAKKTVLHIPSPFTPRRAIVCEPLRIRDIAGKPVGYVVPSYTGTDLEIVRKWNKLASTLNEGSPISAKDFAGELAWFSESKETENFTTAGVSPYTFNSPLPYGRKSFPSVFSGYPEAYDFAKSKLGKDGLTFTRLVGRGFSHVQSFEFKNGSGETVIASYSPYGEVNVLDPEIEKGAMCTEAKVFAEAIKTKEEAGDINRFIEGWRKIDEAFSDEFADDEYVKSSSAASDSEDDYEEDYLFNVPEPNLQQGKYGNACWAYGAGGVLGHHGIFTLTWHNLKEDKPHSFDYGYDKGSSAVQRFSLEIGNTYYPYVALSGSFYDLTYAALRWTEDHGFDGNTSFCTFDAWSKSAQTGWYEGSKIYHQYGYVPWHVVKAIKTPVPHYQPLVYGDARFYYSEWPNNPLLWPHTCPCIGWCTVTGDTWVLDYTVSYDMNTNYTLENNGFYVPEYTFHWTTWYREESISVAQTGYRMHPPGPGIEEVPWVDNIAVNRDVDKHVIKWDVPSTHDVLGFNIYNGTYENTGPPLNDGLIAPDGLSQTEFLYTVLTPSDGAHYVIEVVRETEDDYRYLFPEEVCR